jgi:class 3 adenylate cyclase
MQSETRLLNHVLVKDGLQQLKMGMGIHTSKVVAAKMSLSNGLN